MITEPTNWTTISEENITEILLFIDYPCEIVLKFQNVFITYYVELTEHFQRITP